MIRNYYRCEEPLHRFIKSALSGFPLLNYQEVLRMQNHEPVVSYPNLNQRAQMNLLSKVTGLVIAGAVIGYAYKAVKCRSEKIFDAKFVEHELNVLEGEGGICLS